MEENIVIFLSESNKIEGVYDQASLSQALKAWKYLIAQDKLTAQVILKTHAVLMTGKLDKGELGAWRRCSVWIGGHEAKPWFAVPELMTQWIENANDLVKRIYRNDPIREAIIKDHHVAFESIHPFCDGNGRVGRFLMNWARIKIGLPILIIYEVKKYDYYNWFI